MRRAEPLPCCRAPPAIHERRLRCGDGARGAAKSAPQSASNARNRSSLARAWSSATDAGSAVPCSTMNASSSARRTSHLRPTLRAVSAPCKCAVKPAAQRGARLIDPVVGRGGRSRVQLCRNERRECSRERDERGAYRRIHDEGRAARAGCHRDRWECGRRWIRQRAALEGLKGGGLRRTPGKCLRGSGGKRRCGGGKRRSLHGSAVGIEGQDARP